MTLSNLLGPGKTSEEQIDKIAYSSDASQIRGITDEVVWPETAEEVRRTVKYCLEQGMNIVPRGGGTGLAGGAVPDNSVVIDLSKMNKIEIKGDYATVEPGVVLEDLNTKTEKFLPVVPGSRKSATIGGMIATNAAGMRSIKYGKMMEWVEELEVIDGNGNKTTIGKDKIKDFCGREGTTGIITKAKIRLAEKPKELSLSILTFDNITNLAEKLKELVKNKNVSAVEYLDKITSALAGLEDRPHLIVEYESHEGNIKGQDMEEVWEMRDGIYALVVNEGYTVIEDPEIKIENINKFLYWLQKNDIPTYGHIGIGVLHPHFRKDSPLIPEMFETTKALDGKVSGEHGIGILKKEYAEKEILDEVKKLKKTYDEKNIMNKGKII
jgi:FAD/FMN-containing dehydrogenase